LDGVWDSFWNWVFYRNRVSRLYRNSIRDCVRNSWSHGDTDCFWLWVFYRVWNWIGHSLSLRFRNRDRHRYTESYSDQNAFSDGHSDADNQPDRVENGDDDQLLDCLWNSCENRDIVRDSFLDYNAYSHTVRNALEYGQSYRYTLLDSNQLLDCKCHGHRFLHSVRNGFWVSFSAGHGDTKFTGNSYKDYYKDTNTNKYQVPLCNNVGDAHRFLYTKCHGLCHRPFFCDSQSVCLRESHQHEVYNRKPLNHTIGHADQYDFWNTVLFKYCNGPSLRYGKSDCLWNTDQLVNRNCDPLLYQYNVTDCVDNGHYDRVKNGV
jgi:hypothetical protein